MKAIDIDEEALEEIAEAAAYYDGERAGLGAEFRSELAAALERLGRFPLMYAVTRRRLRACPMGRFPYTLHYIDLPDRIWIAAVAHQSRRPGYWKGRKP